MQQGLICRFFIASPGDVPQERQAACEVLHQWNAAHSMHRQAVIEPVRLETHAQLAQGRHPQDIIDSQLLDRCDVLIAIFYAKLGTATESHSSGTVQEIEEFISRHGSNNVLLMFNEGKLDHNVNTQELEELKAFKASMQKKGLYRSFTTLEAFTSELTQQVAIVMNNLLASPTVEVAKQDEELSADATKLLREAAKDKGAQIIAAGDLQGFEVTTHGKQFCKKGNARSEARWRAVVKELEALGLIEQRDDDGYIFGVTDDGFEVAAQGTMTLSDLQSAYLRNIARPGDNGALPAQCIDDATGEDVAPYQEAMKLFESLGLMEYGGGWYRLTNHGWGIAKGLWELELLKHLSLEDLISDSELAKSVALVNGQQELDFLRERLDVLKGKELVEIAKTRADWQVQLTPAGVSYRDRDTVVDP